MYDCLNFYCILFIVNNNSFLHSFQFHVVISGGSDRGGGGRGGLATDRGGDGGFSRGDEYVVQEDTVFVSGMGLDTSESDIQNHFGSIGIIKVRFMVDPFVC